MDMSRILIEGNSDREECERICRNAIHLFSAGQINSDELNQIVDGQNAISTYRILKESKNMEQKIVLISQPAPQKSDWELAVERMEGLLKNAVFCRVPNQIDHVVIRPEVVTDEERSNETLAAFCLEFRLLNVKKQTSQKLRSAPIILAQQMIVGDKNEVNRFWHELERVIGNTIDSMSIQMIIGIKKGEL